MGGEGEVASGRGGADVCSCQSPPKNQLAQDLWNYKLISVISERAVTSIGVGVLYYHKPKANPDFDC